MIKLKRGDLVRDYEGDLILMIEDTNDGNLIPVVLSSDGRDHTCRHYSSMHATTKKFIDTNIEHHHTLKVVGNLAAKLVKFRESPK